MRGSLRVVDHLLPDDRVGPTHIDHVPEPSYGTVLGEHIAGRYHTARTSVAGAAGAGGQAVSGRASDSRRGGGSGIGSVTDTFGRGSRVWCIDVG